VRLVAHVFATSYGAVDRDLPKLVATHAPDALLMFGLAARRRALTVETRARNATSRLMADTAGRFTARNRIGGGATAERLFPPWVRTLVPAIRKAGAPARLSRDAGRYVCNYLCWRALGASVRGPVAFVHVPQIQRDPRPLARVRRRRVTEGDLVRAGEALVVAMARAARHSRAPQFRPKR
jgi:pyroglutamyl-peptidase